MWDLARFEVQAHRGAPMLAPENTLAGFERAIDVAAMSIETDVHLTRDDVPVLCHDARVPPGDNAQPLVRSTTLRDLRHHRILGPRIGATPVAERFAQVNGIDAYGIPTLAELFAFVTDYAGPLGTQVGKSDVQRQTAERLIFDIELKRMPFFPEIMDDGFDGVTPALLERLVVQDIYQAGVLFRSRVRSFDHRSLLAIKQLESKLETAVLIHETAPVNVALVLDSARADVYCPDYRYVDADIVRQVHAAGKRIIPYTVNEPTHWQRLLDWGVDGVTTDYPDRLHEYLRA